MTFTIASAMAVAGCAANTTEKDALNAHDLTPSAECTAQIQAHFKKKTSTVQGDGHDVIVVPGFASNNLLMLPLRAGIGEYGYTVHEWAGDYNSGPSEKDADDFEQQVIDLYNANGNQKISLIGYSLGGIYARELARAHPDKIRNVVTLSSPIGMTGKNGEISSQLQRISDFYNKGASSTDALDVPSSGFLSEQDAIVKWEYAINADDSKAENIVIKMGHMAMPRSSQVYEIIAERLTYTSDNWESLQDKYCQTKAAPKQTFR